ncbi:hypothetical protein [Arthrobacter sp. OAP107]|uniref:hypothetical protein n=1 Tax=Arthrobacter sp. OAP107 TaxID=3156445 RepID=UPI003396C092
MVIELLVNIRQGGLAGFEVLCRSFGVAAVAAAIWIAFADLSKPVNEVNLPVLVMGGAGVLVVWLLHSGWYLRQLKAERSAEASG